MSNDANQTNVQTEYTISGRVDINRVSASSQPMTGHLPGQITHVQDVSPAEAEGRILDMDTPPAHTFLVIEQTYGSNHTNPTPLAFRDAPTVFYDIWQNGFPAVNIAVGPGTQTVFFFNGERFVYIQNLVLNLEV